MKPSSSSESSSPYNSFEKSSGDTSSGNKPCNCDISHYRTYHVKVVAEQINSGYSPFTSTGIWENLPIRVYLSVRRVIMARSEIAHHFMITYFKCNNCCREFALTAEFNTKGKQLSWQSGRKFDRAIMSADIDRSYEFVKQLYDSMRDGGYDLIFFNCQHWAREFFRRFKDDAVTCKVF